MCDINKNFVQNSAKNTVKSRKLVYKIWKKKKMYKLYVCSTVRIS